MAVSIKVVNAFSFTLPVAEFLNQEVEKNVVDKEKIEKRFGKLVEAS